MEPVNPNRPSRPTPSMAALPVTDERAPRKSGGYHPASPLLAGEPAPSRRAFYRVTYPMHERPRLTVGEQKFVVVDCSELGLRYEAHEGHQPELGSHCVGILHLRTGVDIAVCCEVIRHQERTVALSFDHGGVPFGEIIAEQQYLRTRGYVLGETD